MSHFDVDGGNGYNVYILLIFMTASLRARELCKSRGGRPNSLYGLCGRKATLEEEKEDSEF